MYVSKFYWFVQRLKKCLQLFLLDRFLIEVLCFSSVSRKCHCKSSFSYCCCFIVSLCRLLKFSHFSWSVKAVLYLNFIYKCDPLDCCLSLVIVLIAVQNPLILVCLAVSISFLSIERLKAFLISLQKIDFPSQSIEGVNVCIF